MWVNVPNVCVCVRGREFYFQFDGIWCECVVHAWYVLQCVLYEIWCVAQQLLSKCQQPWWTLNIECHTRKSMPNVKCILISEHSNECFNSTHFLMLFSFFNLDAIDVHSCLSITGHGTTMQPNRSSFRFDIFEEEMCAFWNNSSIYQNRFFGEVRGY